MSGSPLREATASTIPIPIETRHELVAPALWPARVEFPDGQVRALPLRTEPREGELLDSDLEGQWLISRVEVSREPDELEARYDITVESAEGVSG